MAQVVQESDVVFKDQALKEQAESLLKKGANGTTTTKQHMGHVSSTAAKAASQGKAAASKAFKAKGPAATGSADGRGLALCYIGLGVSLLLLIGAVGPLVTPEFYENDSTGMAEALEDWSPLPQAGLAALVLALLAAVILLRRRARNAPVTLPAGVVVGDGGVLCDESGAPLPRGLKFVDGTIVAAASGSQLPKTLQVGPGGVLLHAPTGRPVPHSCPLGPQGGLLSSNGKPLPDSMAVGPNCCLVAADGTVLGPDLQPVPPGFVLSGCKQQLLRPNGKPVPRGTHVGPGFRLLKPNGELMPDGVKIGPCGTIICRDGSILASDGSPLPPGFTLSPDKTAIIDPAGNAIEEGFDLGPNCTLLTRDNKLLTILGRHPLPPTTFSLGPLGNLLMGGRPVAPGAAFNDRGQLIGADTQTVLYSP